MTQLLVNRSHAAKKIKLSEHPAGNEATLRLVLRGHSLLAGKPGSSVHGRWTALIPALYHQHHILDPVSPSLPCLKVLLFPWVSLLPASLTLEFSCPGVREAVRLCTIKRERERTAHPPSMSSMRLS